MVGIYVEIFEIRQDIEESSQVSRKLSDHVCLCTKACQLHDAMHQYAQNGLIYLLKDHDCDPILLEFYNINQQISDRPNVSFSQTVRANSYCSVQPKLPHQVHVLILSYKFILSNWASLSYRLILSYWIIPWYSLILSLLLFYYYLFVFRS